MTVTLVSQKGKTRSRALADTVSNALIFVARGGTVKLLHRYQMLEGAQEQARVGAAARLLAHLVDAVRHGALRQLANHSNPDKSSRMIWAVRAARCRA